MFFGKELILKTLAALAATGSVATGSWFLYDWNENRGMTEYDHGLYRLIDKLSIIKNTAVGTSENELKITTNPTDDNASSSQLTASPHKITVTVEVQNGLATNPNNPIAGKTWKCEVDLSLPNGKTTGTLDTDAKPVEKIRKSLGIESTDNTLSDSPASGKLNKSKVQTNIKNFIKYCARYGVSAMEGESSNYTGIKKTVNFLLKEKQEQSGTFVLPSSFTNLFPQS